jgi:hypothetical protein
MRIRCQKNGHSSVHARQRGLTLRSSGLPPARHLARATSSVIIRRAGQAPCRRQPLSSNVRPRTTPMPALDTLRTELRQFLGEENFNRLLPEARLLAGREPRLRFWQEQMIERFFAANPHLRSTPDETAAVLRLCSVHRIPLQQRAVPVFHGSLDYTSEYLAKRRQCFPHAGIDPVSTEGAPYEGSECLVWLCPECQVSAARHRQSEA